jgi:hypothetical protein
VPAACLKIGDKFTLDLSLWLLLVHLVPLLCSGGLASVLFSITLSAERGTLLNGRSLFLHEKPLFTKRKSTEAGIHNP